MLIGIAAKQAEGPRYTGQKGFDANGVSKFLYHLHQYCWFIAILDLDLSVRRQGLR